MGYIIEGLPIAAASDRTHSLIDQHAADLLGSVSATKEKQAEIFEWLKLEFGMANNKKLSENLFSLSRDDFIKTVKQKIPSKKRLSSSDIRTLGQEYDATVEPARRAYAEVQLIERELDRLVNRAYGLRDEDVELMWRTAPPRMPIDPPHFQGGDAP